jgi:hypothetical protein
VPGSAVRRFGVVLVLVGFGVGSVSGSARAVSSNPRIVVKPNKRVVNTTTTLTGTGFPVKAKLTIEECSVTHWVVTRNPCSSGNRISVVTDVHGRFTRNFRVAMCGGKRGPEPNSRICYIGVPRPEGVDTITLSDAAKITVTHS